MKYKLPLKIVVPRHSDVWECMIVDAKYVWILECDKEIAEKLLPILPTILNCE